MSSIPSAEQLPTHLLAACFNTTTASYKYYWLLAILDAIGDQEYHIPKKKLFARMFSNAWYTVHYFKLSFGPHDFIQQAIQEIKELEQINIDESKASILAKIVASTNPRTIQLLSHFNKQVPHWFLSPWYPKTSPKDIYSLSQQRSKQPLYRLYKEHIEISEEWIPYLSKHIRILRDYVYWNLSLFLQTRNPNVPDIPNKLTKPAMRNSLTKQRKFWDRVIEVNGPLSCIYTQQPLGIGNYHVEHFIPYSFVSHDQIWNLIPADSAFNLSKSNRIPPLDRYFEAFFQMQSLAVSTYVNSYPADKILQEYFYIGADISAGLSRQKLFDVINPLVSIASNNGFEFLPPTYASE